MVEDRIEDKRILRKVGSDFLTNRPMYGDYRTRSFDGDGPCSLRRMHRRVDKGKSVAAFTKVFPRYVNHYCNALCSAR
ncbi:hypothetical protein K8R30_04265 [archaeon]|nr:hypothetical protein [archaeon]